MSERKKSWAVPSLGGGGRTESQSGVAGDGGRAERGQRKSGCLQAGLRTGASVHPQRAQDVPSAGLRLSSLPCSPSAPWPRAPPALAPLPGLHWAPVGPTSSYSSPRPGLGVLRTHPQGAPSSHHTPSSAPAEAGGNPTTPSYLFKLQTSQIVYNAPVSVCTSD